jgi:adenylate cyclase
MKPVWLGASWAAWRHGILAGMLLALLGAVLCSLPQLRALQENIDLSLLFRLRSAKPPPADLVMVAIDPSSAERLSLPKDPVAHDQCADLRIGRVPDSHERLPPAHLVVRWPRCMHALALRALKQAGAHVIALDISFRPLRGSGSAVDARSAQVQDSMLADAITEARNVLVAQWLDPTSGEDSVHRPAPVSSVIESAALGAAPLRLTYGLAGRVNGFAVFSEEEVPISSMPVLAFHLAAANVQADLHRLLARVSPEDAELLPADGHELVARRPLQATALAIRNLLRADPMMSARVPSAWDATAGAVPVPHRPALRALVDMYTGEATRYLNFYGPPGTFPIVDYADLLADAQRGGGKSFELIRGKTVILGYLDLTTEQRDDHYPTVFSTQDGVKLSGTEILATAIANIETDSAVKEPSSSQRIALPLCFGLLLGPALLTASLARGCMLASLLWGTYLATALVLFRFQNAWLPMLVPLLIQAPAGFAYAIAHNYRDLRLKRDRLRNLFGKFLPDAVIEGLLENQSKLDTVSEPVYGVCLVTDAERFTHLADTMHPAELARFLNEYFQVVFPRITEKDGSIIDVLGDAVLAFWKGTQADTALHNKVCGAAIELVSAVDRFNAASATRLPTRIGISGGFVTTTAMGAFNHYEFRPVGETVVTSFRLQDLNKMLGTRMLAAEPVVRDAGELLVRDVGMFQLKNKTSATHVFELMGEKLAASAECLQMCLEFSLALDAVRAGRLELALERFSAHRTRFAQDGPTAFYTRWLTNNPSWDGSPIPQA